MSGLFAGSVDDDDNDEGEIAVARELLPRRGTVIVSSADPLLAASLVIESHVCGESVSAPLLSDAGGAKPTPPCNRCLCSCSSSPLDGWKPGKASWNSSACVSLIVPDL